MVFDSSTVMTPSLPTLSNASAIRVADLGVLRGHGGDRGDLLLGLDRAGGLRQRLGQRLDRGLDALLHLHGRGAGGDHAQPLGHHGLGQHGRRRGAVARDVVGLGRDLLGQLGPHVRVRVLQLHLAGDGDAVVGDRGRAEALVQHHVAALGAERHLDGVRQRVDAVLEPVPGALVELEDLGHGGGSVLPREPPRGPRSRATGAVRVVRGAGATSPGRRARRARRG